MTSNPKPQGGLPAEGAEQDVDLARYGLAILGHWWLVAIGIALGIVVGYLVSLGGGRLFQATATIYVGQPLTPTSSSQVQSLQTNPAAVNQIVKSASVAQEVASGLGIDAEQLRQGTSSKAVAGSTTRTSLAQLVEITVRGPWRRQTADAANQLAGIVVERVSGYPQTKVALLTEVLASQAEELVTVEDAIADYRAALEAASTLPATERLILVSLLDDAQQERGQILEKRSQTELSLALARETESAQIVTDAAATKVAARGRGSSLIVGAVIGLVVGIFAAVLFDPVRQRLRRHGIDVTDR